MRHLSGYGAYKLFLALRAHFQTENYDFIKFQGKIKASQDTYNHRKDKIFFEKLAKRYDAMELRDFYIANFIEGNHYVVDMVGEEAHSHFIEHQAYKESMTYKFGEDLDKIYQHGTLRTFRWAKGEYPWILILYMQHQISLESLVILDSFIPGYRNKFNKYLGEKDILWSVIRLQIDKMKPFVKFDKNKVESILKEKIIEHTKRPETKEIPAEESAHQEAV